MRNWQTYLRDGREAFRRHWKLLIIPIPLALLITIWVVVSTPSMYQSQTAIWSNITSTQAAQAAATNGQTPLTPAAQEQSLLNELLSTDSFRQAVANSGPLAAWLRSNPPSSLTPSGLTGLLHGSPALGQRIRSALLSGTATTVDGPQVLTIGFQANSPAVAQGTLTAMVNTFAAQRDALIPAASQASFKILDPPNSPAGPTIGTSNSLESVLIGLLAGIAVTIILTAILVMLRQRKRHTATAGGAEDDLLTAEAAMQLAANGAPASAGRPEHDGNDTAHPALAHAEQANGGGAIADAAPLADADAPDTSLAGIVRDVRVVRKGTERHVVWVVGTPPASVGISRRTRVRLDDAPHRVGTIRQVETTPEGVDLYVEFDGPDPDDGAPASDHSWIGHDLTLTIDQAPRAWATRNAPA